MYAHDELNPRTGKVMENKKATLGGALGAGLKSRVAQEVSNKTSNQIGEKN